MSVLALPLDPGEGSMHAISELVSKYNTSDKSTLNPKDVNELAKWLTSMVNIFGLNGKAPADSEEIGWSGVQIPDDVKPYLYPLSAMRDTLRQAAKAKTDISKDTIKEIIESEAVPKKDASEQTKPYSEVLSDFTTKLSSLEETDTISKEILSLCDRVRDIDLFDLGIYLEGRENQPTLVRPVTRDLIQACEEKAERARQKQIEKENKEKEALKRAEKGKLSNLDMFQTNEYSAWDEDGLPTKDSAGEEITKSRSKKLRKDWDRQKKAHEAWLSSQAGQS